VPRGVIFRIALCPHPRQHRVQPVWLEEQGEFGVVVSGVVQPGGRIKALADEAVGLGDDRGLDIVEGLAERLVDGKAGPHRPLDHIADRPELVGEQSFDAGGQHPGRGPDGDDTDVRVGIGEDCIVPRTCSVDTRIGTGKLVVNYADSRNPA
jgi:hypothetical protein